MFILEKYLNEKDLLNKNTVVSTVMSNLGFYKALEKNNISSVITGVGDRYVMEQMRANGYNLGGEQSGHIILRSEERRVGKECRCGWWAMVDRRKGRSV